MYTVKCKICSKEYGSGANRSGVCPDCKRTNKMKNNNKYRDNTYEQILFYVKKGEKEKIKEFAKVYGMSVNELCNKAIDELMAKMYAADPREPSVLTENNSEKNC